MTAAHQQALTSLDKLAREQMWTDLIKQTDKLLDAAHQKRVYILTIGVSNPDAMLAWLTAQIPLHEPVVISTNDTAWHPEIQLANRLLIYIPVSHRLQTEEMDVINEVALWRPLKSYAILVGDAQTIADESALKDVEDRMRRLFLGRQFGMGYIAPLADGNCFLLGTEELTGFLVNRCLNDFNSLKQWLTSENTTSPQLSDALVKKLLDESENKVELQKDEPLAIATELNDKIIEINSTRTHVLRRIADSQSTVSSEAAKGLKYQEGRMKAAWSEYVNRLSLPPSLKETQTEMRNIIRHGQREWFAEFQKNDRIDWTLKDAIEPISFVTWDLVNTLLEQKGYSARYPEALEFTPSTTDLFEQFNLDDHFDAKSPTIWPKVLSQTALAGAVVTGVGIIIGTIPAIVTGGLAASLLYYRNRQDFRHQLTEAGQQALMRFVREKTDEIDRRLPEIFEPVEKHYNESFREIRIRLEKILEEMHRHLSTEGQKRTQLLSNLKDIRNSLQ